MTEHIIALALFGSLSLLLLAFVLVTLTVVHRQKLNAHRRELEHLRRASEMETLKAAVTAQEELLKLFSNEIHDNICQVLTGTRMQLAAWGRSHPHDHGMQEMLSAVGDRLGKTLEDLRNMSHILNSDRILEMGIWESIEKELKLFKSVYGLGYKIEKDDKLPGIEGKKELMLFRIIQGALQNIVQHAKATEVSLKLRQQQGQYYLSIKDNGTGIEGCPKGKGMGLLSLEERVQLLKGTMEIHTAPGQGTELIFKFKP